jgi:hypothetical protein
MSTALLRCRAEGPHRDKGHRKLRHEQNSVWEDLSRRKRPRMSSNVDRSKGHGDGLEPVQVENSGGTTGVEDGAGEGSRVQSDELVETNMMEIAVCLLCARLTKSNINMLSRITVMAWYCIWTHLRTLPKTTASEIVAAKSQQRRKSHW